MKLLELDLMRLKGFLSQKQRRAAAAIGIHENTLYRKLKGEREFSMSDLNKIAMFLKCNTMEFLREIEIDEKAGNLR